MWFFFASFCGQFRRRSRSHWNKWGCVHVLRCDFFSECFWGERTTCPRKIVVTCINIGSRTASIRWSCVQFPHGGTEFRLKMILIKLNFSPYSESSAETCRKKLQHVHGAKKTSSFAAELSTESCGKKSQRIARSLQYFESHVRCRRMSDKHLKKKEQKWLTYSTLKIVV